MHTDVFVGQLRVPGQSAPGAQESGQSPCIHLTIRYEVLHLADHAEVRRRIRHENAVIHVMQAEHLQGILDLAVGLDHTAHLYYRVHHSFPPIRTMFVCRSASNVAFA